MRITMNNNFKILYIICAFIILYFLFMNFAFERKIAKNGSELIIINKITNTAYSKQIIQKEKTSDDYYPTTYTENDNDEEKSQLQIKFEKRFGKSN